MPKSKQKAPPRAADDIRRIMLRYFYERNLNATSAMGKKGSAVKISDVKRQLKERHSLTQKEVQSNLSYLISQGWVKEIEVRKQIKASQGTIIPSTTKFYQITAAGIDKIEGPGEFTMPKSQGININATGQSIITLGDGNQINAQFSDLGQTLVELRNTITQSTTPDVEKMTLVADIDTIQSQLAKPQPNKSILKAAWETVRAAASIDGCSSLVGKVGQLIAGLIS